MGIDHRIKEPADNFARCPGCGCVVEFDTEMPLDHRIACEDCSEQFMPHGFPATWDEFWAYCQKVKGK